MVYGIGRGLTGVDGMFLSILFWNRSAERILGHTADEAVGLRCYEVLRSLPESGDGPGLPARLPGYPARQRRARPVGSQCRGPLRVGRAKAHYSNPADYRDGRAEGSGTPVPRADK